jgi:hypothetical protein
MDHNARFSWWVRYSCRMYQNHLEGDGTSLNAYRHVPTWCYLGTTTQVCPCPHAGYLNCNPSQHGARRTRQKGILSDQLSVLHVLAFCNSNAVVYIPGRTQPSACSTVYINLWSYRYILHTCPYHTLPPHFSAPFIVHGP